MSYQCTRTPSSLVCHFVWWRYSCRSRSGKQYG